MADDLEVLKQEKVGAITIIAEIGPDDSCEDPWEEDYHGKLILFETQAEADAAWEEYHDNPNALVVQKFDHSMVDYSLKGTKTYPYQEWDVTLNAGLWVPSDEILKQMKAEEEKWGLERSREWLFERGNAFLEDYSNWANGYCYWYRVRVLNASKDELENDSVGGFYGYEEAKSEAEASFESFKEDYKEGEDA